jgi:hypothetical protein
MALVQATLAAGLANMSPVDNEPEAIDNLVAAWGDYFAGAAVLGIPTTPGSLEGALSAMRSALTGLSSGEGSTIIQGAIVAFWGIIATSAATIWATVPPPTAATPPPGLGGIGAALAGAFSANVAAEASLVQAANTVAAALHPTQLGGIAALPTPPAGPGPQPIL